MHCCGREISSFEHVSGAAKPGQCGGSPEIDFLIARDPGWIEQTIKARENEQGLHELRPADGSRHLPGSLGSLVRSHALAEHGQRQRQIDFLSANRA